VSETASRASTIRSIIAERFRPVRSGELHDDMDLGPPGFGLDSISLIELLVVCESEFKIPFPFTLFDEGPITVGRLVRHAEQTTSAGPHP
jgi:acyl carrier protein